MSNVRNAKVLVLCRPRRLARFIRSCPVSGRVCKQNWSSCAAGSGCWRTTRSASPLFPSVLPYLYSSHLHVSESACIKISTSYFLTTPDMKYQIKSGRFSCKRRLYQPSGLRVRALWFRVWSRMGVYKLANRKEIGEAVSPPAPCIVALDVIYCPFERTLILMIQQSTCAL
jgi:hypothetical protein